MRRRTRSWHRGGVAHMQQGESGWSGPGKIGDDIGGQPAAVSNAASRPAPRGVFAEKAASLLMHILHAARYTRFDLLCVVARLAHDKGIHRLMCYIHSTLHWHQMGYIPYRSFPSSCMPTPTSLAILRKSLLRECTWEFRGR